MKTSAPILILFVLFARPLVAQDSYTEDTQMRAHFSLETKISKKFTVHLDQQYRFTNNISTFQRGSANIGITYKINKNIRLLADYVYIQRRNNSGYWFQRNWYSGALVLRKDFGYWRLVGRVMLQARNGSVNSKNEHLTRLYNRDKLSVRYEISKRLTAYVAEEIYIPLNNPQYSGIDRSRTLGGFLINTFKNQQLELYFMYQHWLHRGGWWDQSDSFNDRRLKRTYVFGIGYGIEF
jgi:hypothetical protein